MYCEKTLKLNRFCNSFSILVHGGWTEWTAWQTTNTCCGTSRFQERTCTNPAPQFGGNDCSGDEINGYQCDINVCSRKDKDIIIDH